ncbi:MAG: disulfide bond formation protein B [Rhodospirillales bacterium]
MRAMFNNRSDTSHRAQPARPWLLGTLLVSLGALAVALAGQFAFGLDPCILCLYERIPYVAVAVVSTIGLVLPLGDRQRRRLLAFAGLVFAAATILSVYHVGIEQHWWASSIPGCVGTPVQNMSTDDLRTGIQAPLRSCDQVDWWLFGLTLAAWNAIVSFILASACLLAARRQGRASHD